MYHPFQSAALLLFCIAGQASAQVPVVVQTNVAIRVMAANITTGNFQRYETPGLNIFKGLKPDVVAVQEFNYASTSGAGTDTPAAFREMIDAAFGTNFVYFREAGSGYSIPNGVISRWPIAAAGSWDDVQVPDRGFAWARIDIPGTNDLFVVSIHLHSSGGASSRSIEAMNLRALIQANFPSNAYVVVAGDCNTDTRTEAALETLRTFLSDTPIPTDAITDGNPNTNQNRNKPYDYVLPSFNLAPNQIATRIGAQSFPKGLVFDSRVFRPLSDVSPVQTNDSAAVNMQHMAVVKDFQIAYQTTNHIVVPRPFLTINTSQVVRWAGVSNLTYTVQGTMDFAQWAFLGSAYSATTNFSFTNAPPGLEHQFIRVVYP